MGIAYLVLMFGGTGAAVYLLLWHKPGQDVAA